MMSFLTHIVWFGFGSDIVLQSSKLTEYDDSSLAAPIFIMYNVSIYNHTCISPSCLALTSFV